VYTPDDNVNTVQDPENNVTTLVHDFAGRRIQIIRPTSRTWKYGYDQNGNMVSEQVPGSTNPPTTDPLYTTTIAYDDLDRPTSKLLGYRSLSSADATYFGADHETFTYDNPTSGDNDTGRLNSWGSYGASNGPVTLVGPTFNAQGQQEQNYQYTAGIAGAASLYQVITRFYNVDGSLGSLYSGDCVGACTLALYAEQHADARGYPYQLVVDTYLQPFPYIYVTNTRNVAGLVTQQGPSTLTLASNWVYDKLGRVQSQTVLENGSTLIAEQSLAYNGNDDPNQLDQYLGTNNHKTFQYTFDQRHQLLTAHETTTTGYFNATYGYGTAGRFATANEQQTLSPPNGNVQPRNVTYQYATGANSDPEEVVALTSGSSSYASFAYDAAGNQTMRCVNGTIAGGVCTPPTGGVATETDYVYDGKDQLRRATKKSNGAIQGSEEYWYGFGGKRMMTLKRDSLNNITELIWWTEEMEVHYQYNSTSQAFTRSHVYTYLSLGNAVMRVDRVADTQVNVEYLYHGLGSSTLAAVDQATGTVNASFSYAPFGEVIEAVDGGGVEGLASHRRRMNDKFVDEVSGLAYYGKRYYDKTAMAWTQGDPLYRFVPDATWGQPRRANLYTFTANNPLRYVDPDGREFTPAQDQAIAAQVELANTLTYYVIAGMQDTIDYANSYEEHRRGVENDAKACQGSRTFGVPGLSNPIADAIIESEQGGRGGGDVTDRGMHAGGGHGGSGPKPKISAKERRANDRARTEARKNGLARDSGKPHTGDKTQAHRDQLKGGTQELMDAEQGIKEAYPDQSASKIDQRINQRAKEERALTEGEAELETSSSEISGTSGGMDSGGTDSGGSSPPPAPVPD
jgi:RHS repeat-associated protein